MRPVEEQGTNSVLLTEIELLKALMNEEQMKNKNLCGQMLKLEINLAFCDQVLEEQDAMLEEEKNTEEVKVLAVACFIVAFAVFVLLI